MKKYAKKIAMLLLLAMLSLNSAPKADAALPLNILGIIKAAVVKVIKAIDLKIQRLQNKTIALHNAQKALENTMSKMRLDEIAGWTEKQKEQYDVYFLELKKVKGVIGHYQRIRDITQKQTRMVNEYERAWGLLRQDKNFRPDELGYMQKVYSGIIGESLENMEQISMLLRSFSLQMKDAERLELINASAEGVDRNFDDLMLFNRENMMLSLQRAKSKQDIEVVKKLYGLK